MRVSKLLLLILATCLAGVAIAQYKVVDPSGRVTYTDRPPLDGSAKVTSLGRSSAAPAAAPAGDETLPFELRQVSARYPVTLYTSASCTPCDAARQLLRQRGMPYTERQIITDEDSAALERLTGGRTVPSLSVGSQALRGFNPADWSSYLDAAGYPAESRLPRGWQPPAAAPLVARVAAAASAPGARPEPAPRPAAPEPQAAATDEGPGSSIRF